MERSAAPTGYLTWPGARQALRRTCRRVIVASGSERARVLDNTSQSLLESAQSKNAIGRERNE